MDNVERNSSDKEISLKELILKVLEWVRYVFSKWKILLIAFLVGALVGLGFSLIKKDTYTAELTFVLEGESSSGGSLGMYAGLARQFGFDLRGDAGSAFSGENFIALLQSRLLIEKTLLAPLDSSRKQSLAEYYIVTHEMWEEWETESQDTVAFPALTPLDCLSLKQRKILKSLYQQIITDHVTVERGEKSSFLTLACASEDEMFSKIFAERLMSEASDFYMQTKTMRTRESIRKLEAKADSIEQELNRRSYAVASRQDLNRNPAREVATVDVELATRDKQILQTIYAELVQNLEITKIALLKETPLIQVIDTPVLPLKRSSTKAVKIMPITGLLFVFLAAIILLIGYIYREIIKS